LTIRFEKIHACGNDFLLFDQPFPLEQVAGLCRRQQGVGADGIILVQEQRGNLVRLAHWDPDGGRSFCINGTRAALDLLHERGSLAQAGTVIMEGRCVPYRMEQFCHLYFDRGEIRAMDQEVEGRILPGWLVEVGNPQWVLAAGEVDRRQFSQVATALRAAKAGLPSGCNVNWYRMGEAGVEIATFERGVEGFTMACGSGILAVAHVIQQRQGLGNLHFLPEGGDWVKISIADRKCELWGPTHRVFAGELP
jgi:diaminopimelate epimerase